VETVTVTVPIVADTGPQTVTDWIQYLHAAAQEPRDSPHYVESRQEMAKALRHINALQVAQTQTEANQIEKPVTLPQAAGVGLMQGLSLGSGEPIAGAISALTGKGFRAGAARYREGLGNVQAQYPTTTAASELAGMLALPGGRIGQGVGAAVKAGVPLTVGRGVGLLAQGAASGAIPGAIAGFSAGGEDPGDLAARLQGAKHGAEIGGLLAGLTTAGAARLQRAHVERAADLTNRGNQRALISSRLAESRARLARAQPAPLPAGGTPEEMAVAKALGIPLEQVRGRVGTRPPVSAPVLTPIPGYPRGLLGPEGISPPAKASYAPSIAEIQGRPGHPIWRGPGTATRSAEIQAPTGHAEAVAVLQQTPFAKLQAALRLPETPTIIKNLILAEIQRRGIVGPGLLVPR